MADTQTDTLLTRTEVEQIVKLRRSSIYNEMRAGRFPEPLKVTPKAVRWLARDIEDWIATRQRSTGATPTDQ